MKERNDVLFKLGKAYIESRQISKDNPVDRKDSNNQHDNTQSHTDDIVVLEDVSDEVHGDQQWQTQKFRGFRKSTIQNPTAPVSSMNLTTVSEQGSSNGTERRDNDRQPPTGDREVSEPDESSEVKSSTEIRRGQYCHFYSNYGKCNYEEKTKRQCRFEHSSKVPMCSNGISCTRQRCMYKHPKPQGRTGFLGMQAGNSHNLNGWQFQPQPWVQPWLNPYQQLQPLILQNGMYQGPRH